MEKMTKFESTMQLVGPSEPGDLQVLIRTTLGSHSFAPRERQFTNILEMVSTSAIVKEFASTKLEHVDWYQGLTNSSRLAKDEYQKYA
eukprot:3727306-Amphidinium_carterae.1